MRRCSRYTAKGGHNVALLSVLCCLLLLPVHLSAQDNQPLTGQLTEQDVDQNATQDTGQALPQGNAENAGQQQSQPEALNDFGTEVAVNGQSTDEQLSAFRVAMRIILLQNSDDKSLLNNPDIQRALVEAETYIDDSQYRVPGRDDKITRATPLTPKVRQSNEATHLLRVQFNEALISGLIADQQEPDGETDPDIEPELPTSALVWLVVDDGNDEHRIGGPTGTNVIDRMREIAGGVGQRLVFPEQDALDLQALSPADMKSGNVSRVLAASRRYNEEVVLVGVLIRESGRSWVTNWTRYYLETTENFNDNASNLDQALQQGTRWLASLGQADDAGLPQQTDALSNQNQRGFDTGFGRQGDPNASLLWISNLQSIEGYAQMLQLIEELETVEVVYPSEVLPSGVLFSISPRFALNDVTSRLAGVSWLRASLPGENAFSQDQRLRPIGRPDATYEYMR